MITIANCNNIADAQGLRIALNAEGIECFIPDETAATAMPHHLFATNSGVRVQVAEDDASKAAAIVGAFELSREQDRGDSSG